LPSSDFGRRRRLNFGPSRLGEWFGLRRGRQRGGGLDKAGLDDDGIDVVARRQVTEFDLNRTFKIVDSLDTDADPLSATRRNGDRPIRETNREIGTGMANLERIPQVRTAPSANVGNSHK